MYKCINKSEDTQQSHCRNEPTKNTNSTSFQPYFFYTQKYVIVFAGLLKEFVICRAILFFFLGGGFTKVSVEFYSLGLKKCGVWGVDSDKCPRPSMTRITTAIVPKNSVNWVLLSEIYIRGYTFGAIMKLW